MNRVSSRAQSFTESVIRGMTRLAQQHDAVNLAQGFPDFAAPEEIKQAAQQAVAADQPVRHHVGLAVVKAGHRRQDQPQPKPAGRP
jgi:aspartate/methionine/tyrosine aminotransferase